MPRNVASNQKIVRLQPSSELDLILTFLPLAGLVFEDAPSGIRSGNAAGCKTVGLLTTHTREQIEAAQPDFIIENLSA